LTNEEKKWKSELLQFSKTSVYKDKLLKRRAEKMRTRMAALIDAGLASEDTRVQRLAQSLREEALFWSEIIGIMDSEEATSEASPVIVQKMFMDYEDPLNAETQVALTPGGFV